MADHRHDQEQGPTYPKPRKRALYGQPRGNGPERKKRVRRTLVVLGLALLAYLILSFLYVTFATASLAEALSFRILGMTMRGYLLYGYGLGPYLLAAFISSTMLHVLLPRVPSIIVVLSPAIAIGLWIYSEGNSYNESIRVRAYEALGPTDLPLPNNLDISRLAIQSDRTDCGPICQRLLVAQVVEEVLYFDRGENLRENDSLQSVAAVAWSLEERETCPSARLYYPALVYRSRTEVDFYTMIATMTLDGSCFVETTANLARATAAVDQQIIEGEDFNLRQIRLLVPHDNDLEVRYLIGGGLMMQARHPFVPMPQIYGYLGDLRMDPYILPIRIGADAGELNTRVFLQQITGLDLDTLGQDLIDFEDVREQILIAVRTSTYPDDEHLHTALVQFARTSENSSTPPEAIDLDIVLAALRNPDAPLTRRLASFLQPPELISDEVLREVASLAWGEIMDSRREPHAAVAIFNVLPSYIISPYRQELFRLADEPPTDGSTVRLLGRLLDFGEEGVLRHVSLLDYIVEDDWDPVSRTIYETVFRGLCDAQLTNHAELRTRILHSIQSGRLDRYEWSLDANVLAVLISIGFDDTTLLDLANERTRHRTEDLLEFLTRSPRCVD